jgi:tetratricopeptide (TPR) repeat protein
LAKYKKKRARELKHDRFRDTTMLLADRLAERVAGRGRQILYGLGVIVILAGVAYGIVRWRNKHTEEAEQAMGRAIAIARAEISATPNPNSNDPIFTTEQARAQRAIDEFQKVAIKYGEPYRTQARYFIATSLLVTDHQKGLSDLLSLSSGSGEVAVLSKFALAQAKEADESYDEAAALYSELSRMNSNVVTPENAQLRLAAVYDKQGKTKEAADLLFSLVDTARKARDKDGKPLPESAAAREAGQELLKIDPARHARLPPAPSMTNQPF